MKVNYNKLKLLNFFILLLFVTIFSSTFVISNEPMDDFTPDLGEDISNLLQGSIDLLTTPVEWQGTTFPIWILASFWLFSILLVYIVLSKAPFFNEIEGMTPKKVKLALSIAVSIGLSFGTDLIGYWYIMLSMIGVWGGFLFLIISIYFILVLFGSGMAHTRDKRREYISDDALNKPVKAVKKKIKNFTNKEEKDEKRVLNDLAKVYNDVEKSQSESHYESVEKLCKSLIRSFKNGDFDNFEKIKYNFKNLIKGLDILIKNGEHNINSYTTFEKKYSRFLGDSINKSESLKNDIKDMIKQSKNLNDSKTVNKLEDEEKKLKKLTKDLNYLAKYFRKISNDYNELDTKVKSMKDHKSQLKAILKGFKKQDYQNIKINTTLKILKGIKKSLSKQDKIIDNLERGFKKISNGFKKVKNDFDQIDNVLNSL